MANIDWPTDQAFKFAAVQAGAEIAMSGWRGFFTGIRETANAGSDRLTLIATLPPCMSRADAAKREAFIGHIISTGDNVVFGPPQRPNRLGNFSGSPVLAAGSAAGARALAISGARAWPNMLSRGTSLDSSPWVNSGVTVTANAVADPGGSTTSDKVASNSAGNDFIYQPVTLVIGQRYTFSVYVANSTPATSATRVLIQQTTANANVRFNWTGTAVTSSTITLAASAAITSAAASHYRISVTFDATETSAWVRIYPDDSNAGKAVALWGAMLETGSTVSDYPGVATLLPGDFIAIGGNLIQVGYAGASADDNGSITVPTTYPLQKTVAGGAAVTWYQPTGLWQLDLEGLNLQYTAAYLQGGVALPFRQVIA